MQTWIPKIQNEMKKIITLIAIFCFPFLIQAQTKGEKIHAKYSNMDEFNSFSFSGSFLNNLDFDIDDEGGEQERNVTGNCKTVKFLTYKHKTGTEDKFKKIVMNTLSKGGSYKEVLEDEDKGNDEVYFYTKGKGKNFSEFHVLHYNENRTSLVSFFGKFHVDDLKKLSKINMDKN
jgi:hypothetical protein